MRGFAYLLVTDRSASFRKPQNFALSSQIGGNQEVFSPQFLAPIRLYGVTPPIRHRVSRRRSAEKIRYLFIHILMRAEIIGRSSKVCFKRYLIYPPTVHGSGLSIFEALSHC